MHENCGVGSIVFLGCCFPQQCTSTRTAKSLLSPASLCTKTGRVCKGLSGFFFRVAHNPFLVLFRPASFGGKDAKLVTKDGQHSKFMPVVTKQLKCVNAYMCASQGLPSTAWWLPEQTCGKNHGRQKVQNDKLPCQPTEEVELSTVLGQLGIPPSHHEGCFFHGPFTEGVAPQRTAE